MHLQVLPPGEHPVIGGRHLRAGFWRDGWELVVHCAFLRALAIPAIYKRNLVSQVAHAFGWLINAPKIRVFWCRGVNKINRLRGESRAGVKR